jgi:ribonuclease G
METNTPFANEELLINFTPQETRLAIVENGVLQEVHIERASQRGLVGNIYCGKVSRVLPGMQAAFVDIGLDKAAFLHASDFSIDSSAAAIPDITDCVCQDQSLVVQVVKDPLGSKGARLTTELTLPSRFLVLMPDTPHVGISQRIEDDNERARLKSLVEPLAEEMGAGFIVRTAAEGVSRDALEADARYLKRLWNKVKERKLYAKPGDLLYVELDLAARSIRDLLHDGVRKILVDSRENYARLHEFMRNLIPEEAHKLEYYPGERPLFDLYNIEDEIQNALNRKVDLKSGGHIVIDQTEAMTTIDVNTGAYVGHSNLEETIFRTNLEAATALARQLRLRNLGGIIIIDFIDMSDDNHKAQVLRTLEKALEKDHAKTHISEVSPLGLVQMTRKRTRESLEHVLCETCPVCHGRGTIKSAQTVCYELFREILRAARAYESEQIMVLASQSVVDRLLDEESDNVAELEAFIERPIRFQVETMYHQEQYDVIPV